MRRIVTLCMICIIACSIIACSNREENINNSRLSSYPRVC